MDYRILCVCSGMMGRREALLKKDNEVVEFETREEAETEAARLTKSMNGPNSTASFRYSAIEAWEYF